MSRRTDQELGATGDILRIRRDGEAEPLSTLREQLEKSARLHSAERIEREDYELFRKWLEAAEGGRKRQRHRNRENPHGEEDLDDA